MECISYHLTDHLYFVLDGRGLFPDDPALNHGAQGLGERFEKYKSDKPHALAFTISRSQLSCATKSIRCVTTINVPVDGTVFINSVPFQRFVEFVH